MLAVKKDAGVLSKKDEGEFLVEIAMVALDAVLSVGGIVVGVM